MQSCRSDAAHSVPALNPSGTAGAHRAPPAAPRLPEPGRLGGGSVLTQVACRWGFLTAAGAGRGRAARARSGVGVGEKGGSDPRSGCLFPSSRPKTGPVGSLPAAGIGAGHAGLPALRCRTVPQAELRVRRRLYWGCRDSGASSCVGVLLCARAAGGHGAGAKRGKDAASWLKLLPESPGRTPGHGGPVALPVWGCAPAPPGWQRRSHACKLPAHDGQRCPWGSPPWEQGLPAPAAPSGVPCTSPLRCWCAPVQGRPQCRVGQCSLARLFTRSHAS